MKRLVFVACAAALGILVVPASPAAAHPLGNFSINQYAGLTLRPDRVDVSAVVDAAEIPTLQERPSVDANHDGMVDDAERAAHARAACRELAGAFEARVGRDRLTWTVGAPAFAYVAGSTGLQTSRLTCSLTAPARLGSATAVAVTNRFRADRVGWREMTAVGDGVRLVDSPLPGHSVSEELRAYPADLLSSALDVRTATLRTQPGTGAGATGAAVPRGGDPVTRWMAGAERHFQQVAGGRLTPVVAALAVLLAVLLGAGHAALPGHGKTVLAAYLAGKRGRARDAVVVGATVTLTHTGGVLVVGLLLSTSSMFAGDRLMGYLGIASGALVTAVGIGMLANVWRRRSHSHPHPDSQAPVAELALVGTAGAGHSHDHGHSHSHGVGPGHHHHHHGTSRWGLAGIGVAGGLVPSPSALVVLLGAIGLGRAGFGVLLVLAYGLGMAGALTGAGLLLVFAQRKVTAAAGWSRLLRRLGPLMARVPAAASTLTAGLVVVVGLGLAARAAAGIL